MLRNREARHDFKRFAGAERWQCVDLTAGKDALARRIEVCRHARILDLRPKDGVLERGRLEAIIWIRRCRSSRSGRADGRRYNWRRLARGGCRMRRRRRMPCDTRRLFLFADINGGQLGLGDSLTHSERCEQRQDR